MRVFLRFPLFLLPVLYILCFTCSCALLGGSSKSAREQTAERAAKQIAEVAGRLNLSIAWDRHLYNADSRQDISGLFLVNDSVCAVVTETVPKENDASRMFRTVQFESMGQKFWLYSIDGGAGAIKWILPFERNVQYQPILDSLRDTETLYVVCGHDLVAVDTTKKEGAGPEPAWKKWQYPLESSISTGPCRTERAIFVGGHDGRMYKVAKDERKDRLLSRSESANGAIVTTPVAIPGNPTRLFFVSDNGDLRYWRDGDDRQLSKPILQVGRVVCDPVVQHGAKSVYLYVASTNSYLYSIDVPGLYTDWMVNLKAPLVATPVLYQDRLLLATGANELVLFDPDKARDRTSEPVIWRAANVKRVLALGKNYIYVATADGRIATLDPASGDIVAWADAPDVDVTITNAGQALYLGSSVGRLWSLQE